MRPVCLFTEFHRIGKEIQHHLHQPIGVASDRRHALRQTKRQRNAVLGHHRANCGGRLFDELLEVELGGMPFGVPRLDLGQVEDLVDEPRQSLALLDYDAEKLDALRAIEFRIVVQDLGQRADRCQGCA